MLGEATKRAVVGDVFETLIEALELFETMADKLAVAGCTNKDGLGLRKDLLDEHSVTETAWRRTTYAYASHVLHGRGHMSVTGIVLHA